MWRAIGLGLGVSAVLSLGLVTAKRIESPMPQPPPVSASAATTPLDELSGRYAARVDVEGRRFHIYVGEVPGADDARHWSVAVPTAH